MVSSCKDLKTAVTICLQRSPCVMLDRNTPKECLENPELNKDLPEKCKFLYSEFMECRRGIVDMRKRFRGNAPLSTGKYDDTYRHLKEGEFDVKAEMAKLEGISGDKKA